MIGFLIIALTVMMIAYAFYRHYFFHKPHSKHSEKPYFTFKIEHE